VSGLTGGGLELQINGGGTLTLGAGATSFAFATALASGTAYTVSVAQQPTTPAQTCTVANPSGTIESNVVNVSVSCTTTEAATYTVGGSISGLLGSGLVLQDNGAANLTVASNSTSFVFATQLAGGASYQVTILTQPALQTCTVSAGSGKIGSGAVTGVAISCVTTAFQVGGTINGLSSAGLVLTDNGGNALTVASGATSFVFTMPLASGAAYSVAVGTQPSSPAEQCAVANGSGSVAHSNVSSVIVTCVAVGRFVYIANSSDDANANGDVAAFAIDQSTGTLTAVTGSPFLADNQPTAVLVEHTDQFVYVTNGHSSDVSLFSPDAVTGALTLKHSYPSPGTAGQSLAIVPGNANLYVGGAGAGDGTVFGYDLNTGSGSLSPIVASAPAINPVTANNTPYGVGVDPSGQFVFATANNHFFWVYSIGTGGVLTNLMNSPFTTGAGPTAVAVWPKGTASGGFVYTSDGADNTIGAFSYDSTGNLTPLTNAPFPADATQPTGMVFDPTGTYLFVANYQDNDITTFTLNTGTGALTLQGSAVLTGCLTACPNPGPIDVKIDPSGKFLYAINKLDGSVSSFTVNAGVLTLTGTYPITSGAVPVSLAVD
jgi:6-phosphogluconolactonase (cycloisomerase 2 family)